MVTSIAYSLGFGSGIDTAALVDSLAEAQRTPKVEAVQTRATANEAKISALAQLTSELENFNSSLAEVVDLGAFRTQPTVSDSSVLSVKLSDTGTIGNLSSKITVHRLASSQTLYSGVKTSATDAIGQGGMTLSVDGTDYALTIDGTNDSMKGLAAAINNSGSGVTASIVNDTGGARLLLTGPTGAANAFTLTADAGADAGLSDFTWDGAAGGMARGQEAADALVEIDGLTLSRSSNSISDIVPGVELTLLKASPSSPVTLGTERQTSELSSTLADFVSVYNTIWTTTASALKEIGSNYGLRNFQKKLGALTTSQLTDHGSINKLADIGISTNRDGTLTIDQTRLDAALAEDPDAVEALLSPSRAEGVDVDANPGIATVLDDLKTSMLEEDGALDAIKDRLDQLSENYAAELDSIEERAAAYRERLEAQFGAMDTKIASLKATQSYLEQQIAIWNGGD